MEAHAKPYMRNLTTGDVCSGPLIKFSGVQKVGDILHALRMTRHNGFPVIDEPPFLEAPELCGLVLRSHLLVLLKGKKFTKNRLLFGSKLLRFFHAFDFAKPGSRKGLKVEDLDLNVEEMEMYVDLYPITNTSPYMVGDHVSCQSCCPFLRTWPQTLVCHHKNTRAASDCWNIDKTRLYAGTYNGTLSRVHPPQGASRIRLAGSQISRDITSFYHFK
ncbi:UNVERIFIED_CONTAM: Chloride channel protein CLC-c [Sesamum radiatum]|uniref:Chloride channel protein CLC-c n=1 Tax=Sesamum radiatum TaxID=300843 RepID=A0AAW2MGR4_SESRA